ncbi:MAG: Crp/Fnr family transcriptional regulator [Oscillospiraceae bacterium]|nr:Crp/Fnr family transcriptional regulator [Oscillospiraceae bacterium]
MELHHRAIMRSAKLFQDISDEEYEALINCLSPRIKHYAKNEILLLTEDSVQHLGIVLAGTASAYLDHVSGSQTLISNLPPLSIFGEVLVSTRMHRSPVTIHAASDVTSVFIEYKRIYSMCEVACSVHRMFLQNVLKIIGDKYFHLFDRIAVLREKTLRAKIMTYLYTLSGNGDAKTVTIPFSKTVLADYLLANRSALSKELKKMEDDGLIVVKKRKIELAF